MTSELQPPIAKKVPKKRELHGDTFIDNYDWLNVPSDPEVISYIESENDYSQAVMAHTKDFQNQLYKEMRARIKEADQSVPEKIDEYYYYTRTEEGKEYPIYCRKFESLDSAEDILFDKNIAAKNYEYYSIDAFKVSPDHKLLAFAVDLDGSETYHLFVKDLVSGEILEEVSQKAYTYLEWSNDSQHIFYSVVDQSLRPYQLYRHKVGDKQDELIYTEEDGAFFLHVDRTKNRQYLYLKLESLTTTEIRYLNADEPLGEWKLFQERQAEMMYSIDHHGEHFYILTNDKAPNYKLMKTLESHTQMNNWQEMMPHRSHVKLDGLEAFVNHLVLYERENGLRQIHILDFNSDKAHRVQFPESVYSFARSRNPEFKTDLLRFDYSSLISPESVYDYNMETREQILRKQKEVIGYSSENYHMERLLVKVDDGTEVPVSIVYKKSHRKDGPQPLHLYGYGSYGINIDPEFSSSLLSLINRGFIYAIAHIRGGGELGREWYENGKMLNKINTFNDFIACAEYLIDNHYTSSNQLSIEGRSAGGLLMGAVTNMRPELFTSVIAEVPFVDAINTMLNTDLPLTVIEFEEWGNPHKREFYEYMLSYSPYDNVEAKEYPNMLVVSGMNDPRVTYWEPTKLVARLRDLKTDNNRLLLKTYMSSGHMGASGRFEYLKEDAFKYAFILDNLGISE